MTAANKKIHHSHHFKTKKGGGEEWHLHDEIAELRVAVLVSVVHVELAEGDVPDQAQAALVQGRPLVRLRVQDLDLPKGWNVWQISARYPAHLHPPPPRPPVTKFFVKGQ